MARMLQRYSEQRITFLSKARRIYKSSNYRTLKPLLLTTYPSDSKLFFQFKAKADWLQNLKKYFYRHPKNI